MEARANCAHPRLTPDPTTGFAACAACGQPFVLSGAPSLTLTLGADGPDAGPPAPHLTAGGRVQSIPLPPEFRKRFELGRVLGRGAAGMVVEAVIRPEADSELARTGAPVAVKFFGRLESQVPTRPNPLFVSLTHEEYIKLNLRHAELHLSFFHAA